MTKRVAAVRATPLAPHAVGGIRTGGRSARVVDDVLTATAEQLGRVGYGALRVEEVATQSGVNKTTIYRRWPTKSLLVAAALRQHQVIKAAPDTGDLVRDLVTMFEESVCAFNSDVMRGVMRMIQTERGDPDVDAIVKELKDRSAAIRRPRLDVAVKRGELPKKADALFVLQLISSAIYSRVVNFSEPVTPEYIAECVRIIVAGARVRYA
ncbi:MAG: TetR/AcrR family transcriptional regulator [Polyangia bacterium]